MDKQTAAKLITSTFENSFDKNRFVNFSKNLVNHLDESNNFLWAGNRIPNAGAFQPYVNSIERIGKYNDGKNDIDVLVVNLKRESSLEHARTRQRNFVARYLDEHNKSAALVAFVHPESDDWRFSLVKMEYGLGTTPTGRIKTEIELTPARRYSFLVGKNESSHTAQNQFLSILQNDTHNPSLAAFEEAFSVEVVTKEFFEKYKLLYISVKESLDILVAENEPVNQEFIKKNIDSVSFAKKLLGQIVFLYFLQKKGWLGVPEDSRWGDGDRRFLRTLFDKAADTKSNFFNGSLEYLFYDALAKQDRGTVDPAYYPRFQCKIPFLNGGLFDPVNGYDWVKLDILLPNELFSNAEKTEEGDTGTGILDIFDRYNFTVKEDEPLEKEVAVDPEMLGKVFENLLEIKDRKSKGTYYTPREIVHYMCQESLINYLDTAVNTGEIALAKIKPINLKLFGAPAVQQQALKTDGHISRVPREDIESLVRMGDIAIEHDQAAVKKQNEIEQGKIKTTLYGIKLKNIEDNAALLDEALAGIRVCDPAIGSGAFPVGMMTEIVRARNTLTTYMPDKTGRTHYAFKRHAIQNCIYGVDLDSSAVEIAKLRLWLSLVVDEDDIKQIQPLPNLDYKVVCGNSLFGVGSVKGDMFSDNLGQLKEAYFTETDTKKKLDLRAQIEHQIKSLTNNKNVFDFEIYFAEVFHEKGGFDIIIANPPYIRIHKQETDNSYKEFIKRNFISAYKDYDIYILFMEKGLKILKPSGILTFITPDKYLVREYGEKIRQLVLENSILELFDISRAADVFDAAVYPLITIIRKDDSLEEIRIKFARTIKNLLSDFTEIQITKTICKENNMIELIDPVYAPLLNKIYAKSENLDKVLESNQIFCGTPRAKDYYAWARYLTEVPKSKDFLPIVVCSNLTPYRINRNKKIRTLGVSTYKPYFERKDKTIPDGRWNDFKYKPKILIRGNDTRITAVLDTEGSVFIGVYSIIVRGQIANSYKYLLAALNSNLYQWIFFTQNPSIKIGGGFFSINSPHLLRLPYKAISSHQSQMFDTIVNQILDLTKDEEYLNKIENQTKVKELEAEIDILIYQIYELTPEEIAVVEGKI